MLQAGRSCPPTKTTWLEWSQQIHCHQLQKKKLAKKCIPEFLASTVHLHDQTPAGKLVNVQDLRLKSQPNDVWTKRDKYLQTVCICRSTFVSIPPGWPVHALPVAILGAWNKKVLATATVSGFSTTVLFKKAHVLVYETLKFHKWFFSPLSLSHSESKGMSIGLQRNINMSTHFPSFLLLFLFPCFHSNGTTPFNPNPSSPWAWRPPWRHVAGSAPCDAYGDAAPCAMAAGFGRWNAWDFRPPLLV